MNKSTFSDSWHLVAEKHASLLPSVETHKQYFRGERWYVLRAPFKNEFFRLSEASYHFVARMSMDRTIEEAWRESMERDPEQTPGQQEVIEILGQLSHANLIHSDIAADSQQLYNAHLKQRRKVMRTQLLHFLFLKVPLFSPDRILEFTKPIGKLLINPLSFLIWLGTVFWGFKLVLEDFSAAADQSSGFLAPGNIPLILVITVLLKLIHEFAHGIFCKHYGGFVPTVGVMFILFAPFPFMDATSSWGFRSRFQRIAVSFAGMYAELFVAAIAAMVWHATGHGTINSIAYNTMLIASVTTLVFNFNPLLKFDGYYIFSDLLDLPNLQQRANKFLQFLLEYYIFGYKEAINPARSNREWFWLGAYGIGASIYRFFLMVSISLILAERFFEIGFILGLFTMINYLVIPFFKFIHYVGTSSNLHKHRTRAWFAVSSLATVIVVLLGVVSVPEHFQEPGVVTAKNRISVHTESSGRVREIHVSSGAFVEKGDILISLENGELEYQMEEAKMRLKKAETRFQFADTEDRLALASLLKMIELEKDKLKQLKERKINLQVRAPQSGLWTSLALKELSGKWLERGFPIGRIGDQDNYEFITVVSQKEAANLFNGMIERAEVSLWGQTAIKIPVRIIKIIEGEGVDLPSAALGWLGGGEIAVNQQDPEGKRTMEPFFQIVADLPQEAKVAILEERTGHMRFTLGERPLLIQWTHDIRQLVQKRLRI